jgi:hypothetical protein
VEIEKYESSHFVLLFVLAILSPRRMRGFWRGAGKYIYLLLLLFLSYLAKGMFYSKERENSPRRKYSEGLYYLPS